MNFEDVIRERFSTRSFKDEKVKKEELDKILEAGRLAPTAKNNQPIKIYVIESIDALNKINDCSPCIYGSKTVLLVCADKNNSYHKGEYSTFEMDASIVATHMMLEATNIGVDNIWIEVFDENILREEFNIPNEFIPICLLPIGYKDENCPTNPNHNLRKDISDIVEYV